VLGIAGHVLRGARSIVVPNPTATRSFPTPSSDASNSGPILNLAPFLKSLTPPSASRGNAPVSEASTPVVQPAIVNVSVQPNPQNPPDPAVPHAGVSELLRHINASKSATENRKRKAALVSTEVASNSVAGLPTIKPPKKKLQTKQNPKGKGPAIGVKAKKGPLVLQSRSRGVVISAKEKAEKAEEEKMAAELAAHPRKEPSKAEKKSKKVAGQAKKVVLEEQEHVIKVAKGSK
jgi:hypothetical protein